MRDIIWIQSITQNVNQHLDQYQAILSFYQFLIAYSTEIWVN